MHVFPKGPQAVNVHGASPLVLAMILRSARVQYYGTQASTSCSRASSGKGHRPSGCHTLLTLAQGSFSGAKLIAPEHKLLNAGGYDTTMSQKMNNLYPPLHFHAPVLEHFQ